MDMARGYSVSSHEKAFPFVVSSFCVSGLRLEEVGVARCVLEVVKPYGARLTWFPRACWFRHACLFRMFFAHKVHPAGNLRRLDVQCRQYSS